jgi:rubrerythrin
MPKSLDDLQAAFAGESQANRRYLAFAEKADAEGHPQVARLFRAAAQAETVHAHNHLRAMDGIKSTTENLQVAIQGENYEHTTMYPGFIKDAETEENKRARRSFDYAKQVEVEHEGFYRQALESLGKDKQQYDYYICPVCGHTVARGAPDICPICSTAGERFIRVS